MAAILLGLASLRMPLHAQSSSSIFVPFVSRLQGEIRSNLLRLSWTDSPDAQGPVSIYRSTTPFVEGAALGRPAEVPYGVGYYIDEVDLSGGVWYYFVVASDEAGRRYEILIPYTNTIGVSADSFLEPAEDLAAAAAAPAAPLPGAGVELTPALQQSLPAAEAPPVSAITAAVNGEGVVISFHVESGTDSLVLYRSVQPLKRSSDLVGAVIVQSGVTSPFTDYPVPGISYYYAVVSEREVTRGTMTVIAGINATAAAVEVASAYQLSPTAEDQTMRSLPLPTIALAAVASENRDVEASGVMPSLSPEAARALEGLPTAPRKAAPEKYPQAFSQDLETPGGGEEYALRSIVQDSFRRMDWDACREDLLRYLALPRSTASEARARFYLGQCYYFLGETQDSLFEFLAAESEYPDEAAEWIQAVLAKILYAAASR